AGVPQPVAIRVLLTGVRHQRAVVIEPLLAGLRIGEQVFEAALRVEVAQERAFVVRDEEEPAIDEVEIEREGGVDAHAEIPQLLRVSVKDVQHEGAGAHLRRTLYMSASGSLLRLLTRLVRRDHERASGHARAGGQGQREAEVLLYRSAVGLRQQDVQNEA